MLPIEYAELSKVKLQHKVFGHEKVNLVVELALGATIARTFETPLHRRVHRLRTQRLCL